MSAHAGFILAAYALTGVAILGLIAAIAWEHRSLRRALDKYPPREGLES